MSSSAIPVSANSTEESVGSSASLIILSDSDSEAPPSPVHHAVADHESDPSEAEAAILSRSSSSSSTAPTLFTQIATTPTVPTPSIHITTAPPAPLPFVPVSTVLPRRPTILVLPGQKIPFGRPYHTLPNGVCMLLTARNRVHPFPACIPANRRRSRYVSSSSSSPPSRKRRRASPYSYALASHSSSETSSASDTPTSFGPSRKRCRSPATSFPAATPVRASLSLVVADYLPPCKRLRGSPAVSLHEETVEDTDKAPAEVAAKPATPPVHAKPTVGQSLKSRSESYMEDVMSIYMRIYPRLKSTEEGQRALKDRAETAETERANLRGRVRSLEISDLSLQDTLRA
ncbi:hypothetical protein Tco_1538183 [Tanacetum coccineum]